MSRATPEMLDNLAEGLADGLSWRGAAIRAGYSPTSRKYYRLRDDPSFERRIERCRRRREWGGIGDLGDMVGALLKTAQAQGDTAERNLSRLCLVSASQLFVKMMETPLGAGETGRSLDDSRRSSDDSTRSAGRSKPTAEPISDAEELQRALDEWAARVGVE